MLSLLSLVVLWRLKENVAGSEGFEVAWVVLIDVARSQRRARCEGRWRSRTRIERCGRKLGKAGASLGAVMLVRVCLRLSALVICSCRCCILSSECALYHEGTIKNYHKRWQPSRQPRPTTDRDMYSVRVVDRGGVFTGGYSFRGESWEELWEELWDYWRQIVRMRISGLGKLSNYQIITMAVSLSLFPKSPVADDAEQTTRGLSFFPQ